MAVPSSALYWHIGETTMRLVNSALPSLMGVNREDMRFLNPEDFEPIIFEPIILGTNATANALPGKKWLRAGRDPDDVARAAARSVGARPDLLDFKTGSDEDAG